MSLLPYDAEQLSKEDEDKALSAINESEFSKKDCVETLKNLLKDKGLKRSVKEELLLMFLRGAEFDCEKAADNLLFYDEGLKNSPEYFKTCVLDALTKSHLNPLHVSPYRMKDNSLLLISRYFLVDVEDLPLPEKVYLDVISGFHLALNPINQICGITVVADCIDFSLSKLPHYTNYKWITVESHVVLNSLLRIKQIHVINASEAAITAYNVLSPLLPKKMVDLLQFHSDSTEFKDLHEFVPPEILPERYGGHLRECELINCTEDVLKKEDYFRKYFPLI